MSPRSVKFLAGAVVVLFGILFVLNSADRESSAPGAGLLFPELKNRLNDINTLTITDADGAVTVQREAADGPWVVSGKDGYPADTAALRQLLLALADARKLEQKTSDPELYDRLGVADPREESVVEEGSGTLVTAAGKDAAVSVIIGDVAQREYRYVRLPEQPESWLIDQNPTVPAEPGDWLLPQIVDVESSRIRSVTIRHGDGEVLHVQRETADQPDFEVEEIPEGRELSYPTVANSIANTLANLSLEDVRARTRNDREAAVTTDFSTFDGLQVRVNVFPQEAGAEENNAAHGRWISLQASAMAEQTNGEDSSPADDGPAPQQGTAAEEAAAINERVSGWTYRIPGHKANQLTRRWDDILSDEQE
ncbi:MAG: DUF4340 domain-containing protein [Woeseia sp.]